MLCWRLIFWNFIKCCLIFPMGNIKGEFLKFLTWVTIGSIWSFLWVLLLVGWFRSIFCDFSSLVQYLEYLKMKFRWIFVIFLVAKIYHCQQPPNSFTFQFNHAFQSYNSLWCLVFIGKLTMSWHSLLRLSPIVQRSPADWIQFAKTINKWCALRRSPCSTLYYAYRWSLQLVGTVTSGCPSPNLKCNISMAYVPKSLSKLHTQLKVQVRNHFIPGIVTKTPFIPPKYYGQR